MTTDTARHLLTCIRHWPDLADAVGARQHPTWPPTMGIARLIDDQDRADHAAALRVLERSPDQIGWTAAPIHIDTADAMRAIEAALVECADVTAAVVQRSPMPLAPRWWPATDRARRDQLAREDATDRRRWRYVGTRTAPYAAAWLLARVQGAGGPFRPLDEEQHRHIARVAQGAAERVERALDLAACRAPLADPCPDCQGVIEMHGGSGAPPVAHCTGCGTTWGQRDAAAA
ncbi:hypothetical protein U9R90_25050 [Streptomyces sp. E11-3]|uniref:hypothetical protein n=1 Tax=Streptomyces sp. E11-3 TaxID=3110112 RepID=UPI00397EC43A